VKSLFAALSLSVLLATAHAEIQTEEVSYSDNGTTMQGYLAYDDSIEGQRPGVLVVHEWWGHNDYARRRAEMLAELGYTALAVDMYGDGQQAEHPDDAGKFATAVMQSADVGRSRFLAAMELLQQHETVNPDDIAAIGYCFGGAVVLNMARSGVDLDGVVSFHGSLSSPISAEPGEVEAQVLVLHGGADKFITDEQVQAFKDEMEAAGADYEFVSYPGVLHSFTNPEADANAEKFGIPIAYDAEADEASWARMQAFFQEIFGES